MLSRRRRRGISSTAAVAGAGFGATHLTTMLDVRFAVFAAPLGRYLLAELEFLSDRLLRRGTRTGLLSRAGGVTSQALGIADRSRRGPSTVHSSSLLGPDKQ